MICGGAADLYSNLRPSAANLSHLSHTDPGKRLTYYYGCPGCASAWQSPVTMGVWIRNQQSQAHVRRSEGTVAGKSYSFQGGSQTAHLESVVAQHGQSGMTSVHRICPLQLCRNRSSRAPLVRTGQLTPVHQVPAPRFQSGDSSGDSLHRN